ncbi:uncharacterized protein LOC141911132 isoform X2 [Tubulanus polymorphus]|uniref:uncharacterized protein LOC141911132 isoform X2 n=1 Tax=Tubulanus polymorphus TaxID=672921 RepID=UPI003DA511BE
MDEGAAVVMPRHATHHSSAESAEEEDDNVMNEVSLKLAKKRLNKNSRKEKSRQKRRDKNHITEGDYYNKLEEFKTWLHEEKGLQIEEIEPKVKAYFKKFVKKWNSQQLSKKYYRGIDQKLGNAKTPSAKHNMDILSTSNHNPLDYLNNTNHLSTINGEDNESSDVLRRLRRKETFSTFGKGNLNQLEDENDDDTNADCSDILSVMSSSTAFTYDTISLTSFTSNVIGSRFSQASLPSSCDTWSSFSSSSSISVQNQNDYCRITRSRSSQSSLASKISSVSAVRPLSKHVLSSFNQLPINSSEDNEIKNQGSSTNEINVTITAKSENIVNADENADGAISHERPKKQSFRGLRKGKQKILERMSSFANEPKSQCDSKPSSECLDEEYIKQQYLVNHQNDCDRRKALGEMTRSPSNNPRLILQRYMDECDEETFV